MRVSFALLLAVAAVASARLSAHIEVHSSSYAYGDELPATLTVFNPTLEPLRVLTWGTPLEGVRHPFLRVEKLETHTRAAYTGMLVKRGEPVDSAFVVLEAGEAVRTHVDIASAYHFLEMGMYEIEMAFSVHIDRDGELEETRVTSNAALVFVTDVDADLLQRQRREAEQTDSIQYFGCSSSQKSIIQNALTVAKSDAQQAYMYLLSGSCTTDYSTFFGAVTSSRFNTVFNHFDAIVSALNANTFEMDCSTCDMPGTYAYVYPFDPRKRINLCEVFWKAPSGSHQFNSQPGTITHETSHFNAVAGTDDLQYGVVPCKLLANSDPSKAIQNADSHEFFQEMNPKC